MNDTVYIGFEIINKSDETPNVLADEGLSWGAKGIYSAIIRLNYATVYELTLCGTNPSNEVAGYLKELKGKGYIKMESVIKPDKTRSWIVAVNSVCPPPLPPYPFPLVPLPSSSLESSISYPPIIPLSSSPTPTPIHKPFFRAHENFDENSKKEQEKTDILVNKKESKIENTHTGQLASQILGQLQSLNTNSKRNGHSFGAENSILELFKRTDYTCTAKEVQEFMDVWNGCLALRKIETMRHRHEEIRTAMSEQYFRDNYRLAIKRIAESSFCRGKNRIRWKANVDWFLKPETIGKVLEGWYDDKDKAEEEIEKEIALDAKLEMKKKYSRDVI